MAMWYNSNRGLLLKEKKTMAYRTLKILTILVPTIVIGGFEFIRHTLLYPELSMKTGNYIITILTFIISTFYANWMFRTIEEQNQRISKERELRAVYEERERLAKELHDNIAQSLFLLKVDIKKGKVKEAGAILQSIDNNLRQAIFNLRLKPSEHVSFSTRIENWIEEWVTVSGMESKVEIQLENGFFLPQEEVQLFGIIQEAFANIRKHARASVANLQLRTQGDQWQLVIRDDGVGFVPDEIPPQKYGLLMLKERAAKIDGEVHVQTGEGNGTTILVKGVRKK